MIVPCRPLAMPSLPVMQRLSESVCSLTPPAGFLSVTTFAREENP